MAHVEGASGVGGHVLEVHVALALGDGTATEIVALLAHLAYHTLQHRIRQADVNEARAGYLHGGDHVVFGNVIHDDLGDLAGALVSQLGHAQGHRARPIAVGLVAGSLEGRLGCLLQLQRAVGTGRVDRGVDDRFEGFANFH